MSGVCIPLEWIPVLTVAGEPYLFPMERRLLRAMDYRSPGVYRWAMPSKTKKNTYLVGETEDIYRRLGEYLKSPNTHHENIRRCFSKHIAAGGKVGFETLRFGGFSINDVTFVESELRNPHVRRLLEAICCITILRDGSELLNDTLEKRQAKKLAALPADTLAEALVAKVGRVKAKQMLETMAGKARIASNIG